MILTKGGCHTLPPCFVLGPRVVSYSRELPTSPGVLLAVEVADTTARFDRLVEARLHARAGIPEFRVCLAADGAIEVHRAPGADGTPRSHCTDPAGCCRHSPSPTSASV